MRSKDEAKEKLILDTALQLITRRGLTGLKMSDLARQTGLATGTLYVYFADKTTLIHQLYAYLLRQSLRDLNAGINSNDPIRLKIQKTTRNYLNDSSKHPEYTAFFEQYFRSSYGIANQVVQAEETNLLEPIYDLVRQGQRDMIIKEATPDLLVSMVCGMLDELARQSHSSGQLLSESDWTIAFSVIWDGIKR